MDEGVVLMWVQKSNKTCAWKRLWLEVNRCFKHIANDLVIICDTIIDTSESVPVDFIEKKATCKMENFYILLVFLLITISLLIIVSVYYFH